MCRSGFSDPVGAPKNHRVISALFRHSQSTLPSYINPVTGGYRAGGYAQVLSVSCVQNKSWFQYWRRRQLRPASTRLCNDCNPTLPKDLSNLTVAKLKEELKKRCFPITGLKAVLVDRLTGAVASEVPAQRPKPGLKTPNTYQYQPTSNSRQQ